MQFLKKRHFQVPDTLKISDLKAIFSFACARHDQQTSKFQHEHTSKKWSKNPARWGHPDTSRLDTINSIGKSHMADLYVGLEILIFYL